MLKVNSHGLTGLVSKWIEEWLRMNRTQRVLVRGAVLEWSEVLSGVPRGSVLGPISMICILEYVTGS